MKIKICKKCGSENYAEMKFCSECGNPFTEEETFAFCSECGTKNSAGEKFCSECGAKLGETDNDSQLKTKGDKDRKISELKDEKEEDYIFCPNCGAKSPISTKFCEECGTNIKSSIEDDILKKARLEEPTIVPIEANKGLGYIFCPNCVAKNASDTKFCEECGSSIEEAEGENAPSEAESDNIPLDEHDNRNTKEKSKEEDKTNLEEPIKIKVATALKDGEKINSNDDGNDYIFCPNCGARNTSDTKYCCECGSSLEEITTDSPKDSGTANIGEFAIVENDDTSSKHDNVALPKDTKEELEDKKKASLEESVQIEEHITDEDKSSVNASDDIDYVFCANCGFKNANNTKFCCECGSKLKEEASPVANQKTTTREENANNNDTRVAKKVTVKKIKPKKSLKIVIVLLILAIVGGGCFFAYKNGLFNALLNKNTSEKDSDKKDNNKDNTEEEGNVSKDSWSSWVEELPENISADKYDIEEKIQYSVSKREEKTSNDSNLKGWTLDEKKNASNELVKEIETNSEIKKFESLKNIKIINREVIQEQYVGVLCGYYSASSGQNRFYLPDNKKPYCSKDDSYTLTDKDTILPTGSYKVGDDLTDKSYTNTDGTKIYYRVVEVLPYKVKYTYVDTEKENIYYYYRWTAYSKYSDEKVEESETVKVKERKVYRYKAKIVD